MLLRYYGAWQTDMLSCIPLQYRHMFRYKALARCWHAVAAVVGAIVLRGCCGDYSSYVAVCHICRRRCSPSSSCAYVECFLLPSSHTGVLGGICPTWEVYIESIWHKIESYSHPSSFQESLYDGGRALPLQVAAEEAGDCRLPSSSR